MIYPFQNENKFIIYLLDIESPPSQSVSAFSDQSSDKPSAKQLDEDVSEM